MVCGGGDLFLAPGRNLSSTMTSVAQAMVDLGGQLAGLEREEW